jgi:hypothetical protein
VVEVSKNEREGDKTLLEIHLSRDEGTRFSGKANTLPNGRVFFKEFFFYITLVLNVSSQYC